MFSIRRFDGTIPAIVIGEAAKTTKLTAKSIAGKDLGRPSVRSKKRKKKLEREARF